MAPSSEPLRPGFATPEGTQRFAARFAARAAGGYFRERHGLNLSSIGIGTYLGEPDAITDSGYSEAIVAAVEGGVNVVDSAINYRLQRSERAAAAALEKLAAAGFGREEILVCTKAGFLTADGDMPPKLDEYFYREFVEPGIFRVEDVAAGCHCLAPAFLEDQLERSRKNLGMACLDVFYIHNPETQLSAVSREEFRKRIVAAFCALESAAGDGRIRMYGVATWNGFRNEIGAQDYLSLEEIAAMAREAGGAGNHFRFVQLPLNLAMPEALIRPNQALHGKMVPMVQAAREFGITLIASASLLQGHLSGKVPAFVHDALELPADLKCALQFARSAPGITTALVGMRRLEHVSSNLELIGIQPSSREQFLHVFQGGR